MANATRSFIHFMQPAVPINFKERVTHALTKPASELWFPELTYDLMRSGVNKLYKEIGITEAEYGTARVIYKNPDVQRFRQGAIYTFNERGEIRNESFVEMLPSEIAAEYKKQNVTFYDDIELLLNNEIGQCLRDAFEIIRYVPTLFTSVRQLVKSIHLIKPEDDDNDVSFSEPHIPFSIFVSVPQKNNSINALRVSEAIIHEAMHLQLTLIENIVPLIVAGEELVYSPWKDEYRTPQGVLHAVYVFKVLQLFLVKIAHVKKIVPAVKNHADKRINLITQQLVEVKRFEDSISLTDTATYFTKLLFSNSQYQTSNHVSSN